MCLDLSAIPPFIVLDALRELPVRLVRYYAYVPDAQDPSVLRRESSNFLHDVTLRWLKEQFRRQIEPEATDRAALIGLFLEQLSLLGQDYVSNGTRTVNLVDGLDHIAREQHRTRSLLSDLPAPSARIH